MNKMVLGNADLVRIIYFSMQYGSVSPHYQCHVVLYHLITNAILVCNTSLTMACGCVPLYY